MNKTLSIIFSISFSFIVLHSCLNSNVDNAQNQYSNVESQVDSSLNDKKYSTEEELRVYGDIKFGISKSQYQNLVKQRRIEIGDFKYEFIPKFNHNDELYELVIKGAERTKDEYKREHAEYLYVSEGPKPNLIRLIQERYGAADKIIEANINLERELYGEQDSRLARNSLRYDTYVWDINNKRITVFLDCIVPGSSKSLFVDVENPKLKIYPIMKIVNTRMELEVDSVNNSMNTTKFKEEANKF